MVVTPEMVKAWQDACDDFKSAGEPDAYSLEEVKNKWLGLSRNTACSWAIYGLVVQDELSLEQYFNEMAQYIEKLRVKNSYLRTSLNDRQAIMDEQLDKIQSFL
jgi:hypothetical protein